VFIQRLPAHSYCNALTLRYFPVAMSLGGHGLIALDVMAHAVNFYVAGYLKLCSLGKPSFSSLLQCSLQRSVNHLIFHILLNLLQVGAQKFDISRRWSDSYVRSVCMETTVTRRMRGISERHVTLLV
jgi:hypothetical protein